MATRLHDLDVLRSLATGAPGPARDWANTHLALRAPEEPTALPERAEWGDLVVATRPPGLERLLIEALEAAEPCTEPLALSMTSVGVHGSLPPDPEPLVRACRDARPGDGSLVDAWLTIPALQAGMADRSDVAALAAVDGPETRPALVAAVLLVAGQQGVLQSAAAELARDLEEPLRDDAELLWAMLEELGAPGMVLPEAIDPETAARLGNAFSGALEPLPHIHARGSRRRCIQRWVSGLLDGVEGPAAALLRSVYQLPDPPAQVGIVAVAAWLRGYTPHPDGPVPDVLERRAGADLLRRSAARRAVADADADDLLAGRLDLDRAVLSIELLDGPRGTALADRIVDRFLEQPDPILLTLATIAVQRVPDRVPELLFDRFRRDGGLMLAAWTPTTEVLEALLHLPMPADPNPRVLFGRALAGMGERAALPALREVLALEGPERLARVLELSESLLGERVAS